MVNGYFVTSLTAYYWCADISPPCVLLNITHNTDPGAMEKLVAAEKRCEQTLIEQTNTLKRMRASEETARLEKHGLDNKVEEHR